MNFLSLKAIVGSLLALVVVADSLKAALVSHDAQLTNLGYQWYSEDYGGSYYREFYRVTLGSIPSGGNGLFAIDIIDKGAGVFEFGYAGIAEEYSLHAVAAGQFLTPSFVAGASPLVSNNGYDPGSYSFQLGLYQTALFGFWDDRSFYRGEPWLESIPDSGDLYGWFSLTRTESGLELLESATAVGGGIIAGAYTQIPEPSTWTALAGVCAFLFALLQRRNPARTRASS